jgi:hypothetical protein
MRSLPVISAGISGLLLSVVLLGAAQNQTLKFEVASVKAQNDQPTETTIPKLGCHGTDGFSGSVPSVLAHDIPIGHCMASYFPVKALIAFTYDIPWRQDRFVISGGPQWGASDPCRRLRCSGLDPSLAKAKSWEYFAGPLRLGHLKAQIIAIAAEDADDRATWSMERKDGFERDGCDKVTFA